jgi:hypothetical protein
MDPSDYDAIPLYKIVCLEVLATGGIKQTGKQNSSENGRGSWVASAPTLFILILTLN